ncbi:immunoglobulin A1 protease [Streptococcus pneumoniae]|nr:immunoglobulin A1 protease [Streptococcus pneumoniae]
MENDDETYYLVYKLNSQNQLAELPNTGSKNERQALVAGASLAALGILIFAVSKKRRETIFRFSRTISRT